MDTWKLAATANCSNCNCNIARKTRRAWTPTKCWLGTLQIGSMPVTITVTTTDPMRVGHTSLRPRQVQRVAKKHCIVSFLIRNDNESPIRMLSHALRADKSERIEEVAHVALDHLLTHIQARPGEQDDKNTNSLCLG